MYGRQPGSLHPVGRRPLLTFTSFFIEDHSNRESALEPHRHGADYRLFPLVQSIDLPTVWATAREHALPVDYVDNCWIRVAVDAPMLRRFLAAKGDPKAAQAIARIEDDHWYVLNEEEY